jgi:catechol 2,3-dioxygenase-like lactoylglutathione lyase family enzyme
MLGYVTIGTRDLEQALSFYDKLTAILGARRIREFDRGMFYGVTEFELAVVVPENGRQASVGNGSMVALKAPDRASVDQAYALALSMGGQDEGPPGIRGRDSSGFYAAYFRDPEHNKICVFNSAPA